MLPCKRLLVIFVVMMLGVSCAPKPAVHEGGAAVAVWDLDDLSLSSTVRPDLGELLSAQIIEALKKRGNPAVVERQRLLMALEELRLGTTRLVDETTRLRLGQVVGARWMIFGSYQVIGGKMRIDLRVVEVETGKVKKAVETTTSAEQLQGWIDATHRLAEGLF
jgi:curli biogenesis system outer membrane secretion channel CsgG